MSTDDRKPMEYARERGWLDSDPHASSKREAKLSPYSKEAVLKREAEARANSNRVWGTCAHCGGDYTLKKDGTMRAHGGVREHGLPFGVNCPGSGKPPGFVPSTDAIPNSAAQGNDLDPDSQAGSSATRKDAGALSRATRNRVRYVHLPAWFAIEEDGRLRLCDEAEAEEARRQLREP